jgi:hypothetical protein
LHHLRSNEIAWLLRAVLRVTVLVVTFSLTGFAGVFESAATSDVHECCADCPGDDHGDDCPPGCPNCHCAHGSVALPRRADERVAVVRNDNGDILPPPSEATAPRAPTLPGLYRPPRVAAFEL